MATRPKAAEAENETQETQGVDMNALLQQMEAMRREIERMKAAQGDEEAAEKAEARAALLAERKRIADEDEEYVEIKLFKDSGKYKDDVFVAVNGEGCLIKRGERVKIKRKFAKVLDASDLQDAATADLIDSKVREFEQKSKEI